MAWLVATEIVHDDDIAALQGRSEDDTDREGPLSAAIGRSISPILFVNRDFDL